MKWKDRSTFQKILFIFVWVMIIVTLAGVVFGAVVPLLGGM
ncbi:hypothetical protein B808_1068 [Fructilactobacillus florum 8D]|uniref:DUF4044 domain-containing protein n=1 Tax=Fructilactobacillus florum 8D TaxID=1221538 RepID=W9EG56_9LACO|nr:DUF4044 domain-containing protein [Fructilactobacillus florum]EKK20327.1 hypothetical protein B807_966 [Fructilactobacillus florum 2F]ETO39960.1 hypothetical protein B808_1068 [Fructilactobacillus florum 8D]